MQQTQEKKRIAWFSNLNLSEEKTPSISAYYSDVILPLIQNKYEIEVFTNSFRQYQDFSTFHYLTAFQRHQTKPFDLFFYQLEDLKEADFVRSHLGLIPGVVLFHDFLFTNYGPEPLLNSAFTDFVAKFNGQMSEWPPRGKEYDRDNTLAVREAALTLCAVFTNERNLNEYRHTETITVSEDKKKHSFFLPYPAFPGLKEEALKKSNKSATGKKRIIFCGGPRIEHRAHKVLSAVSSLQDHYSLSWLIASSERQEVESLLGEFGISDCTIIEGRSPEKFSKIVTSHDVAVHTLFSAFGQCGAYLSQSLTLGIPCIVTNFGAPEYLPANLVFKIQAGDTEAFEIKSVLARLLQEDFSNTSEKLQTYAAEFFDARVIAQELCNIFDHSADYLNRKIKQWDKFEQDARLSLVEEVFDNMKASFASDSQTKIEQELFKVSKSTIQHAFDDLGWQNPKSHEAGAK